MQNAKKYLYICVFLKYENKYESHKRKIKTNTKNILKQTLTQTKTKMKCKYFFSKNSKQNKQK